MKAVHLDTQVAVWMLDKTARRLSPGARRLLSGRRRLAVSPFVAFELSLLHEVGRTSLEARDAMKRLQEEFGALASSATLSSVIERAMRLAWTRDPFDRLIVANAMADGCRLLTADARILANFADAIW